MKLKNYKDWKFNSKLYSLLLISIIPLVAPVFFYILPAFEGRLIEEKKSATKKAVEIAYNLLLLEETKINSGLITEDAAQNEVKKLISSLRYNGSDYFWINDINCRMVMHPIKPELNGQDLTNQKDPNGVHLFVEFTKIGKEQGEGYVDYMWPKPGIDKNFPKIAYVKLFNKWGWVLGSGIYIDDMYEVINNLKVNTYITLFLLVFVVLILSYFYAKKFARPIINLTKVANNLALGDVDLIVESKSNDEIGDLEKSFSLMINNIKDQANIADEISKGNFDLKINSHSEKDILSKSLEQVTSNIKTLVSDLKQLTKSTQDGNLSVRGKEDKFLGGYREIISGVNATLDAVITPIKEGSDVLSVLATGDLTARVNGNYMGDHQIIKNSINTVADSLNTALLKVNEVVQTTAAASSEISSSIEEMAAGSQEQSAQLAEVASAVEEMAKTVIETSKNTNIAAENSKIASDNAKKGASKIEETMHGMKSIVASTEEIAKIISSLAGKTEQIGEITLVIDDIADQTNLLALNAAIEAARAGEQGRGFAVVADEVRKLAERTTKATKEIADTIKTIQKEAKYADSSMVQAGEIVKSGMELTEQVADVLKEILVTNADVSDMVNQVAAASEEQSATAEQIRKNIETINNVSQQSADGTHQIAKAAGNLNQLTYNLQGLIENFNLTSGNLAVRANGKLINI
jgi:methyl-accepting chemotaxis protein